MSSEHEVAFDGALILVPPEVALLLDVRRRAGFVYTCLVECGTAAGPRSCVMAVEGKGSV